MIDRDSPPGSWAKALRKPKQSHKYGAKKTKCWQGHDHPSKKEASRCDVLHDDQKQGKIDGLEIHPVFTFVINGAPVMMKNGQPLRYTADFKYNEAGKPVVEDSKGFVTADFRIRAALFRHLNPETELRIT
jgi:hypothetical protein